MKQMTFADAEYTGKRKQTCTVKKGKIYLLDGCLLLAETRRSLTP
jgi:hypothetical protein